MMREKPKSFIEGLKSLNESKITFMPPVDTKKLLREENCLEKKQMTTHPFSFAISIKKNLNLKNSGTWDTLSDGSLLWRLQIKSKGADSLNLGITKFKLPQGAKLWIYNPSGEHIEGPYMIQHKSASGQLWTPIITGDQIVVELYIPKGGRKKTKIKIGKVNHAYRDCLGLGKPGKCIRSVVCPEGKLWQDEIRAVALYHFTRRNKCMVGSGVLLNNTAGDFKPYFLTARHIGLNCKNAGSMVIYWNYEAKQCEDSGGGNLKHNQIGAKICAKVKYKNGDCILLELNEKPDSIFNVFYSGWDASGNAANAAVGIHHPRGKEKAISISKNKLTSTDFNSRRPNENGNFWLLKKWDKGSTEAGSSGSGLWDKKTKLLVGHLSRGLSFCVGDKPNNRPCWYGKFSACWKKNAKLRQLLDPIGIFKNKDKDPKLLGAEPLNSLAC